MFRICDRRNVLDLYVEIITNFHFVASQHLFIKDIKLENDDTDGKEASSGSAKRIRE